MKRCRVCGAVNPLDEFYKAAGTVDGHRGDCKACNLAAQAARRRADPEPNRQRVRDWQAANPERVKARRVLYQSAGRKRVWDRRDHLRRNFGLTLDQYEAMLASQGGVCALCRRPPRPDISLHVDHDHETGRIRGLLCFRCNNALGSFEDDPVRLRAAASYVEHGVPPSAAIGARLEELRAMTPAWVSA